LNNQITAHEATIAENDKNTADLQNQIEGFNTTINNYKI